MNNMIKVVLIKRHKNCKIIFIATSCCQLAISNTQSKYSIYFIVFVTREMCKINYRTIFRIKRTFPKVICCQSSNAVINNMFCNWILSGSCMRDLNGNIKKYAIVCVPIKEVPNWNRNIIVVTFWAINDRPDWSFITITTIEFNHNIKHQIIRRSIIEFREMNNSSCIIFENISWDFRCDFNGTGCGYRYLIDFTIFPKHFKDNRIFRLISTIQVNPNSAAIKTFV